ncbi:D-aminoacyl-tRNA deacylase [Fusobacterium gastrosuis]|uniref:D-aminoacyl-tRNA deacylase n=1 Tax=Fusobacterium gastrosuis TaxID=1755100 RepID=UPI002976C1EB|nr:D-aminoacyl-tRNA deacylase [Fusobacteriaceae bacterium]MDD7410875.1 D-aminoacyl-tRNA deacylase [Fusobacteriaceae bacterium]MDY5305477.1 D-aminoacyl-tRNA deacylase [Fusobacterium gastrosuis]MDY5713228.1 D-aminoacyl-tRNA deacylase [Fusobacterium gastrosuis]MDY5794912.1 D-aminoacyl-tRNA deacylase [Fusobacterium gastrosuis]
MRTVIQRVKYAQVQINGLTVGKIEKGFLILLGINHNDTMKEVKWLANKIKDLRIFEDENDKMNLSLKDVNGEVLIISQFTLYGNCIKGRRPSFIDAAKPELANELYLKFIDEFRSFDIKTETGKFGADMKVELLNDGPVTLIIDTADASIK